MTGVIDWVNADHGDRHLDVATTSAILSTTAMDHPRWMRDNALGNSLRALFNSLYLPLYHVMAPLEFERLRYCQAVAALLRLSMLGMMRARGPEAAGGEDPLHDVDVRVDRRGVVGVAVAGPAGVARDVLLGRVGRVVRVAGGAREADGGIESAAAAT